MEKKYFKTADTVMREKWWQGMLIGAVMIIFGVLLLVWPGITSGVIVKLIGLAAAAMGIFRLVQVLRFKGNGEHQQPKSMLIVEAVVGIVIGIMAFAFPGLIEVAAIVIIGIGMIYYGIFDFWAGFSLHASKVKTSFKWLLVINGILSVIVGIFLLSDPLAGLLTVLWVIGFYAIAFGGLNVALSFLHPNRK
jgi:uncharacterized membrane protein HdeD (DUF308 family)